MKTLLLFAFAVTGYAQSFVLGVKYTSSDPSPTCTVRSILVSNYANGKLWQCQSGTYVDIAGRGGGGGGTVTSVGLAGTANQITVTGSSPITSSGSWTLSIPTNPTLPGTTTGTFSGSLTGNASTATALAANPADCSADVFANAIAANGDLTCAAPFTLTTTGSSGAATFTGGTLNIPQYSGGGSSNNGLLYYPGTFTFDAGLNTIPAGNDTTGVKYFLTASGKSMKGIQFPWKGGAGAKTVKVTLWDLGTGNTGGSSLGTATVAVNASAMYEADFSSPISLTQYHFYTLAAWENSGANYSLGCTTCTGTYRPSVPYQQDANWVVITEGIFSAGDAQPTSTAANERYTTEPVLQ